MMGTKLNAETISAFRRDGAVALRGLFKDWVETLRAGFARNMAEPSADVRIYQGKDGGGRFFGDYCNWNRIPEYRDFIFNSGAAVIGRQLMGTKTVRLFHEHVLVKEPGADVATPWHQDQPYYCVDGTDTVSLWIPLDHIPREHWNSSQDRIHGASITVPNVSTRRHSTRVTGWSLCQTSMATVTSSMSSAGPWSPVMP
jgi:ectoine hydroxylase-related dioxygenase (phytanoyl-CoA dioxygenase family)